MSSKFASLVAFDLCSLARLWLYNLWAVVGDHFVKLPVVIATSWSCILGCLYLSVWHQHSVSCQVFLCLWFLCSFVWRASLLWIDLGTDLYMIPILYWCILRRIHCLLWDSIATSFLKISISGLWSVIIHTSLTKQ